MDEKTRLELEVLLGVAIFLVGARSILFWVNGKGMEGLNISIGIAAVVFGVYAAYVGILDRRALIRERELK